MIVLDDNELSSLKITIINNYKKNFIILAKPKYDVPLQGDSRVQRVQTLLRK